MQLLRVAEPSAPLSKELYNICCRVNHLPFYMYIWKYVTNLLNLIDGMHLSKCRIDHTFSASKAIRYHSSTVASIALIQIVAKASITGFGGSLLHP